MPLFGDEDLPLGQYQVSGSLLLLCFGKWYVCTFLIQNIKKESIGSM